MKNEGMTTINQIIQVTQRQSNTVSTLVNRMAKQGLVSRKKLPDNKRKYEVAITKKGTILYQKVSTESIASVTETFSCLSDKDKQKLGTHLGSLLSRSYQVAGKEFKPRSVTE